MGSGEYMGATDATPPACGSLNASALYMITALLRQPFIEDHCTLRANLLNNQFFCQQIA